MEAMLLGKKWAVILSRSKARFLSVVAGPTRKLKLVSELANPAARGRRSRNNSFGPTEAKGAPEELAIHFVTEICDHLEKNRQKKVFDGLLIVAEPHVMGILKKKIKTPLKKLVVKWVNKDLEKVPLKDLPAHLPLEEI